MAERKRINPKYKGLIAVIIAVLTASFLITGCTADKEIVVKDKNIVYVKDDALYMHTDEGDFTLAYDMGSADSYSTFFFGRGNAYNNDNSIMYYCSDLNGEGTYTLSRVKTDEPETAVLIDRDVLSHNISGDGSRVAYLKAVGGNMYLYVSNGESRELIRENVTLSDYYFQLCSDGKHIFYAEAQADGKLYCYKADTDGENKVLVAEDIIDFAVMDTDELVFTRNNDMGEVSLYVYANDKEKLICDSMQGISFFENDAGFVFLEKGDTTVNIWDIVVDDMSVTDKTMEPPKFADYGHEKQEEYLEASYAYTAKQKRDTLREEINLNPETNLGYSLYRYDKKGITKLSDSAINIAVFGEDGEYVIVDELNISDDGYKLLLSEVTTVSDIPNLYAAYKNAGKTYIVSEGAKAEIETDGIEIESSMYDKKSGKLMFVANIDPYRGSFNPVAVEIANGEVTKYSYIEDMVDYADFYENGNVVYVSVGGYLITVDGGEAKTHDEGVSFMTVDKGTNDIYYISNMSTEDYTGTLKVLSDGTIKVVDSSVTYACAVKNGEVVYIKNYDETSGLGDLYAFDGSTSVLVAQGVTCVMDIK